MKRRSVMPVLFEIGLCVNAVLLVVRIIMHTSATLATGMTQPEVTPLLWLGVTISLVGAGVIAAVRDLSSE